MTTRFTREEAEAKLGQWVKTRVEWASVAAGTIGKVVKADSMGHSLIQGKTEEVWDVVIRWDWPRTLHDNFTKDEYETYLEEVRHVRNTHCT